MRWKKALLIAFFAAFLFISATGSLAESNGETAYRAMLIGIESYTGTPIEGCLTDVNRMMNLLQSANEAGARYLTPVTRTNLKAAELRELLTGDMLGWGVDNDDVTLLYFAGLGMISEDNTASLTARDGEPVKLTELRAALDQLPGTKIVILDCRYLESIAEKSKRTPAQLLSLFNRAVTNTFTGGMTERDYQVLTSMTMVNSVAQADLILGLPCGPFTYYLSQACGYDYVNQQSTDLMADVNANGAISVAEARDFVQAGLSRLSKDGNFELTNSLAISPQEGTYPLFSKRETAETLSITLDQPKISIAAGTTTRLNASVLPLNAQQQHVSWVSSDLGICSVDENGVVTGLREGEASVTAISPNGMSDACDVLVRKVTFADSVSLNPSKLVIGTGQQQSLQLTIKPADSNELVTWKSSDNAVATVDQSGLVSLIRNGQAVITATTESGKEVSCVVQAVDPDNVVTQVAVDATEVTLYEGEARLMVAKVKPSTAIDQMVTWTSSDEKVAQVGSNGLIAGIGGGDCVVYCTASSGVAAEVKVHVNGTVIELKSTKLALKPGGSDKLSYALKPAGVEVQVTWDSSAPEVATVSPDGTVTAVADGLSVITASLPNGQKATCQLSVAAKPVSGIKISKKKLGLLAGDTYQFTYKIAPSDASINTVTWSTSDENVAVVAEDGTLTAVGVGKCTVAARSHNGKAAKCQVQVKAPKVKSIQLSSSGEELRLGQTESFQLDALIEPETPAGNRALKWASNDKNVVTVDPSGLVKIVGEGKATVRASSGKVKADCTFVITTNRTFNKKPQYGNEKKVYASLRQVSYSEGSLIVQMYFVNRTKSATSVPTPGILKLSLRTGEAFELTEISAKNQIRLGVGDHEYYTYKFPLEDYPQLKDLDLSNAKAELLPPEDPTTTGVPKNGTAAPDGLIATGEPSETGLINEDL